MMTMTPGLRKFALTAHITFSVGWLGAVAGFLALAIAGLTSKDAQLVRAAYLAMKLTAWFVIVPLAFASLLTGIIQSVGTAWGLFRHYWVLAKLVLTVFATVVLLLKMKLIGYLAGVAAETTLSGAELRTLRIQLVVHAAGGLLVLLAITALSVFKPWGMTAYGRHKLSQTDLTSLPSSNATPVRDAVFTSTPRWMRVVGFHAHPGLVVLFVILHLQWWSRPPHAVEQRLTLPHFRFRSVSSFVLERFAAQPLMLPR